MIDQGSGGIYLLMWLRATGIWRPRVVDGMMGVEEGFGASPSDRCWFQGRCVSHSAA